MEESDAYQFLVISTILKFPRNEFEEAEKWYRSLAKSGSNYKGIMLALVWYENPSEKRI